MTITVANLAAGSGLGERKLAQVLRLLASRKTQGHGWRRSQPLLTVHQTSKLLNLDEAEIDRLIERPVPWTDDSVVEALFTFHRRHGRWPMWRWEWTSRNKLPSPWKMYRLVNPGHYNGWQPRDQLPNWRQPWDVFQRRLAADTRCTPEMAFQLTNALARKEAIERIGFETLLKQPSLNIQIRDDVYGMGTLYAMPGETPRERLCLLKVTNSTAEPDGSFSEYYLRVPPFVWDVRQALAWTFNLGAREYAPLAET